MPARSASGPKRTSKPPPLADEAEPRRACWWSTTTSATCSPSAMCWRTLARSSSRRSGEEALRHLLKGEFAVILLDVYMPGMDGYETAQIIREREQTKRIPIVFLSAVNKETEHLHPRLFDGRGRLCLQAGRSGGAAVQSRGVRRPVRQDPRDRAQGAGRSRRCSTPICAPMPSGCEPNRSFAAPKASCSRPRRWTRSAS